MEYCLMNVPQCVDALPVTALTQNNILENITHHPHLEEVICLLGSFIK